MLGVPPARPWPRWSPRWSPASPGPGHPGHGDRRRHASAPSPARVLLIATRRAVWGAVVVTVFVLLDMLDGALARARGGGSVFGAVLDSSLRPRGRRARSSAALVWWFSGAGDNRLLVLLALLCLVLGVLTSYVKARAEGVGISCDVGIVERTERLILVLVGTGFTGLGIRTRARRAVGAARRQRGHRRPADRRRPPAGATAPSEPGRPMTAPPARARPHGGAADRHRVRRRLAGRPRCCPSPRPGPSSTGAGAGPPAATGKGVRQLRANLRVVDRRPPDEAELDA